MGAPTLKESLGFKQRPARRSPRAAPAHSRQRQWFPFRARAWGAGGRSRVPVPRARVFSFCPAYPRRQGGAGSPCPRLAVGRIPAPASALSPGPLAGRLRAVRGARRGLGRLASAWLVRGGVRWLLFLRWWWCGCGRRRCGGCCCVGLRAGWRCGGRLGPVRSAVLGVVGRWCRRVVRCSPRRPARAGRMTGRGGECGRAVLRGRPVFWAVFLGGRTVALPGAPGAERSPATGGPASLAPSARRSSRRRARSLDARRALRPATSLAPRPLASLLGGRTLALPGGWRRSRRRSGGHGIEL